MAHWNAYGINIWSRSRRVIFFNANLVVKVKDAAIETIDEERNEKGNK